MKHIYIFLVGVLALVSWNIQAQTAFTPGSTLCFSIGGWEGEGDANTSVSIVFSESLSEPDATIFLNKDGRNSAENPYQIIVPAGNYFKVQFKHTSYWNSPVYPNDPAKNWFKISSFTNFSWSDEWCGATPIPVTRLEDFNFFPIIINWENPGIGATVTNYYESYTNSVASSSKVVNPDKTMNETDFVYEINTNNADADWWTGVLVQFAKPIAVSNTNKFIHIALKTAAPDIEFAFVKDNANNSPAYAGVGSISSNGDEWVDYVYDLQSNIDNKGWGNNWNCTGFRMAFHTNGTSGAVNRVKAIYIDEIIINDDPSPRTLIPAYGQWTGAGGNDDWNNRNNWTNGVPSFISTDAIIPGGLSNYPVLNTSAPYPLDETITFNDCNSITIEAGASLGNQHLLTTATDATVKYSIPTDRWNFLATPIAATVRDFHANKAPSTWVQTLTASTPGKQWSFLTALTTPLAIGDGFAFFVDGDGSNYDNFSVNGELAYTPTVDKTLTFTAEGNQFALVGNPFVSTIDFDLLADETQISDAYYIYTGTGYSGYHTSGGSFGYTPDATDLTQYIAPLQSFIVEKGAGTGDLTFDSAIQATNAPHSLRANINAENKLNIVASNSKASVKTIIAEREGNSATKLFDVVSSIPDVYTLHNGKTLGVQLLETNEALIPLGLRTNYAGILSFTFTGMDSYNAHITFNDLLGETIDLTDMATFTYKLNYTPVSDNEESRFFIQLAPKTMTGIGNVTGNIIGQRYYNLQGVEIARPVEHGVYLIKNLFESGRMNVVKLVQ